MNPTIKHIMAICGDMPNPFAHRHYLEQLNPLQLQARLDDLRESEQKHAARWVYPRREVRPTTQGIRKLTTA